MRGSNKSHVRRFIFLLLMVIICLVAAPAMAKYSGGSGTAEDPYQISTAEDLMRLGDSPEDYDKHFILTADIDLDPNLPGRKVFDKAVIAPHLNPDDSWPFEGTPFSGTFEGNNHTYDGVLQFCTVECTNASRVRRDI
jgi:hypothetical protein